MKAVGLYRYLPIDDPESFLDVEIDTPGASGRDLLVEVKAISVNPVDTKRRAPKDLVETSPRVLGWDVAGVVKSVGPEVALFKPGDAVYYAGSIVRPGGNSEFHLVDERIAGRKPATLGFAEAAALPLTTITAWEGMFDRMGIARSGAHAGKSLLIIAGAGGVGSIAIQLAKKLAGLKVIASASRPESAAWVRALGADHVVDHGKDLAPQLEALGMKEVDYIFCLNNTDRWFPAFAAIIKPMGKMCAIVSALKPVDLTPLMGKSVSLSWEFMFTRSTFQTPDMIEQHRLLNETAALIEAGTLKSTFATHLGKINAANLKRAHKLLEGGHTLGKIVLEGFSTGAENLVESRYAWTRLAAALALMTIGGSGMYVISVVLPLVQADFGVSRSDASLPYAFTMLGFGLGGVLMGRLSDRFGVMVPVILGAVGLAAGFFAAGTAGSLWEFNLAQGLLIGLLGTSATFAPLVADISLWFTRRRGIAVAICISGNYLAGAFWPPVMQQFIAGAGWRQTYIGIGVFCLVAMLPLALVLRRRPPIALLPAAGAAPVASGSEATLGLSPGVLQALLCVAGVACCVAMSMPQVHIVAYCGDLGYGPARGAEMLSLMLACGIVSRLASGWISDRIGGLRTLLLGSTLQMIALFLFLPFTGLVSLYLVAALFGLFQGGIVPSYALIVREHFKPREAGARVGTVLMATLFGMALGGWMSGAIFDFTGSYRAAFVNGIVWNLLNLGIVAALLYRLRTRAALAG